MNLFGKANGNTCINNNNVTGERDASFIQSDVWYNLICFLSTLHSVVQYSEECVGVCLISDEGKKSVENYFLAQRMDFFLLCRKR